MSPDDRAIIAEFVVESQEHLADIENELLTIEAAGAAIDSELVNKVFRAIHSIKGATGFFGFTVLQSLSHEMENVLNLIRNRQLVPTSTVTDALLRAADRLRAMIEDIEHSNETDVSERLTELRAIAGGKPASAAPAPAAAPKAAAPTVAAQAQQELEEAQNYVADAVAVAASPAPAASVPPVNAAAPAETNIRVSVRVLDHLMNLAGELVLSRNQLMQAVGAGDDHGDLDSISARLNQVTSELQEAIMQTRLQVVETVFSKFPRVVRDLSNTLGKQCDLLVEGEDVELDKSIIEAIGDPLTHLIRNAVDHGVETPDVRRKAGKPAKGRIVLKAFHQAGKVNIAICDDGAGIDAVKLKDKAVSQGLITAEQARSMGERETLRLIFHPGFSLAAKVTSVSGRGVGMDVVRTNIERLGGTVEVQSQLGQGTAINITLPLTLAIIPSLVVRCQTRRFALPQSSISELVRVKGSETAAKIQRVKNAEVFRLRGALLPLVRLNAALGLEAAAGGEDHINIIVVETGHMRYGLIVDGLHDSQEIVVKPLGKHMKDCRCFAGATILGDGQVALILDVAGIAAHARLAFSAEAEAADGAATADRREEETQTMLLFSNAPHEHFAVPMELISRLERIRSDQIDAVGGHEILQYRGSSLALLSLENHLRAKPRAPADRLYVVVFHVMDREVGLIVPSLDDIRPVSVRVDMVTFREPGVVGSLIVDGRTTRIIDLYELSQAAHPDWFAEARKETQSARGFDGGRSDKRIDSPTVVEARSAASAAADAQRGGPSEGQYGDEVPAILLAEDSDFFRKQVQSFLEEAGHRVVACEDGLIAWNALRAAPEKFHLVVTDLEMPNLNGFELTERVKSDPATQDLTVMALTSLASEEAMERGKRAGIDRYLVKLDREQLTLIVGECLAEANRNPTPAQAGGK